MFGNGFYNPYLYQPYYQTASMTRNLGGLAGASGIGRNGLVNGLGKGLLGKFTFSGFLNGASKTLNVVNQAIPIFYQVRPIINNAKTMFRIMGAVKEDDHPKKVTSNQTTNISKTTSTKPIQNYQKDKKISQNESPTENPVFFI